MTNLWAHQSQNKNLFNPFLARKKRCKYLVSPGVTLIPGFVESLLSQVQHNSRIVIPAPNGAGSYPTSLDKQQRSPSFSSSADPHCITQKCHCWSTSPHPPSQKRAWESPDNAGSIPNRMVERTRWYRNLLRPARHKALSLLSFSDCI